MAVIQPTATINPATMAANWGPGVINNANKWQQKTLAPRVAINADPQGNQQAWSTGVQGAIATGSYAKGLANTDMAAMANGIATYGAAAYSAAGTQKAGNYAKKTQALATAETAPGPEQEHDAREPERETGGACAGELLVAEHEQDEREHPQRRACVPQTGHDR